MKIACIGSQTITPEIAVQMEEIGRFVVDQGWWLASGNAKGSDAAYARGANESHPERVILYLPEPRHNPEFRHPKNLLVTDLESEWEDIAARHHPTYPRLNPYIKRLMIRNAGIVRNADAVVAYLNRKKIGGGGTGHGWRIAETLEIPRLDISLPKNREEAIAWLTRLPQG